jgi:pimeloyl-ACP methyl ester carboxylesterase
LRQQATAWRDRGSTFNWAPEGADAVDIFHVEAGDPSNPTMLLVHGFPTCSIDWFDLVDLLSDTYYICALDFPGYGFSSKPLGWGYSLARDAALLDHYLSRVLHRESAIVVAHDRGTSVSMLHTLDSINGRTATRVDHLVLTNGNIFLPLSNLTDFQRIALNPETAPSILAIMTPEMLAQGLGQLAFTPSREVTDPEIEALVDTFAHDDGIKVLHETIQYLVERAKGETDWLEQLAASDLPTTIVWGMNDTIAPPRVPSYVWNNFFMLKPGNNRLYFVPDANHYLLGDRPDAVVQAIRHALDPDSTTAVGALDTSPGSPVLVDCSRTAIPKGTDILNPR